MRRVQKTSSCWIWLGGGNEKSGYGHASFKSRTQGAHRVAWLLFRGAIPKGRFVLHKCDVRRCVKPAHLFLGTHQDNMDDMYAKGRGPTGNKNGSRTRPHRRAFGDRNGSRTCPESRERGDQHWTRRLPDRVPQGVKNGRAKHTATQIRKLRWEYARGDVTQAELGRKYGLAQAVVSRIIRRKTWKHIED